MTHEEAPLSPPTHDGELIYACDCWPSPPTWKQRWLRELERWELESACTKCKQRLHLRPPAVQRRLWEVGKRK